MAICPKERVGEPTHGIAPFETILESKIDYPFPCSLDRHISHLTVEQYELLEPVNQYSQEHTARAREETGNVSVGGFAQQLSRTVLSIALRLEDSRWR
jgi:hypothetical protein